MQTSQNVTVRLNTLAAWGQHLIRSGQRGPQEIVALQRSTAQMK